ncbi:MAG: hypothetical protein V6Z81_02290 [Parvularculales bacterium]
MTHNTPAPSSKDTSSLPWLSRKLLWIDHKKTPDRILYGLFVIAIGFVIAGYVASLHGHYAIESVIGFYGLFGFIMCILLVLVSKFLRRILKRPEDYYHPYTTDTEEPENPLRDNTP